MKPKTLSPRAYVIVSVDPKTGETSYVYDTREGLVYVPRYATEAKARKANAWAFGKDRNGRYAVKHVLRKDIRAWEADINEYRNTAHHRQLREREAHIAKVIKVRVVKRK